RGAADHAWWSNGRPQGFGGPAPGVRLAGAAGAPRDLTVRSPLARERDRAGLGHRKRGRLRHLEALRAEHPIRDPLVDLVEELVDEEVARDLLQHAPVRVDEADIAAARDPEVGVACLPRPVDGAAEHRHLEGLRIRAEPLLDALGELLHADVVAAAARAGDH